MNQGQLQSKFQALFDPKSIAFVGASNSPEKWGFIVLKNLMNGGYQGPVFPVNPREKVVLGMKAYNQVKDIPGTPDLAVIVIPPPAVSQVIGDCVEKGIRAGVIITAGFAEVGGDGEKLQNEVVEKARKGQMILVGPNCNGIARPSRKLFPQMPAVFPQKGPLAVVSQSGNVAVSLSRRGIKAGFGLSCIVSSGNEADLHCEDYFEFLAHDSDTKVIISYIEGFRSARRFFDVAKGVVTQKPLIMIKAGGTTAGAKAAKSHTASLAGSDSTFDGACRQAGIIRAADLQDLFNTGIGFLNQPSPRGNRTAILTAGGGWGVLAADSAARYGLEVVQLSDKTLSALNSILPTWWNPGNPVDMVAGNVKGTMMKALKVLIEAPETDCIILLGVMGFFTMQPISPDTLPQKVEKCFENMVGQLTQAFDEIRKLSHYYKKPVVTGTEFPFAVADMEERFFHTLGVRGFALYKTPDETAKVMSHLVNYGRYFKNSFRDQNTLNDTN